MTEVRIAINTYRLIVAADKSLRFFVSMIEMSIPSCRNLRRFGISASISASISQLSVLDISTRILRRDPAWWSSATRLDSIILVQ
jgi:hypothetical protein